jgi:nicotinamide mononucleotide (NMN) deamidase PncC
LSAGWSPDFIRLIHDAPGKLVLCVTGGGSLAISSLLKTPGASRTVLEAAVPYDAEALVRWLHARPEQFCSEATARAMAMSAYMRAREYAGDDTVTLAGISCTASLASDRPKHGPHRVHAALQTGEFTLAHSLELTKGQRCREAEEVVAASMLLNLVAEMKQLSDRLDLGLIKGEQLTVSRSNAPPAWQKLLSGATTIAEARETGEVDSSERAGRVVFPGAFHPRHDGHRAMAKLAAERTGRPVDHELSIVNVDKPPIDFIEMERRAGQFSAGERLWFTRASTFVEKAAIFPRATFIVGTDTILRIADAKYYGDDSRRDAAFAALAQAGCRFLVFGRCHDEGFHSLCDLKLPDALHQLCDEVPGEAFRMDVSSTAMRRFA